MPTEHDYIDVRDLFASINPNGLDEKDLARDGASFVEPHTINDYHLFRAGYQAALEAQQGQGESIRLTAVATLEEDGDGGLEPNWLLEGGTAELLAGMTLLVADNAPHLCDDDGSAQVYTHADPTEALNDLEDAKEACAEIERTGTPGEVIRGMNDELVDARAQLDGLRESMEFRTSLIGRREAQLAEAHALLRLIAEQPMLNGVHRARIKTLLSASAEPSAPVEIDERAEFRREDRYIVIKRRDLKKATVYKQVDLQLAIDSLVDELPVRECLVIESDWPEYEPTWAAIEARAALERKP